MSTVSRRSFLKNSTLLMGGFAAQHFLPKTGISLARIQSVNRPLRMLTLGDSVVWGQGLLEENKFSHLVKRWLEQEKGIGGVDLKVMAHSGATIKVGKELDTDPKWGCMDGEINRANPTIPKQVSLAAERYCSQNIPLEDVDLILLNGGINDVDKLIFGGIKVKRSTLQRIKILRVRSSVEQIRESAIEYCDLEMKRLLLYVASTFPNARIVVTGYFPIITCSTPASVLPELVMEILGLKSRAPESVIKLVENSMPKSDEEPKNYCQGLHVIIRRLSVLSEAWRRESNAALCRAAKWINETRPWTGRVNPSSNCTDPSRPPEAAPPESGIELCTDPLLAGEHISRNRVFFAAPKFEDQHGYGVPSTSYLWRLVANEDPIRCVTGPLKKVQHLVITEDQLHDRRPCWCCEAQKANDIACIRAGTFHPNIAGAMAYRDSIVTELSKVYAATGWGEVQWGPAPPPAPAHATTGETCTQRPCPD